ncbi:uncharacterized protein [Palaemon carinicauda]
MAQALLIVLVIVNFHSSFSLPEFINQGPLHVEHDSVSETDDHLDWKSVGEVVKVGDPVLLKDSLTDDDDGTSNEDSDNDESKANLSEGPTDLSDPIGISDDACAEVLNVINAAPLGLRQNLLNMNLDLPKARRGCFKSRNTECRTTENSLCNGPLYVIYEGYRFCCPTLKQPILERSGNHFRCSC